jgi:hypothetical protein|tara:strand:- start:447 stop:737 length:291 start_codon:yes stop_codon:yes gene_type:complete
MHMDLYATFIVRLSNVTTITPGIIGPVGGGRTKDACFMKLSIHASDIRAPFMVKEMVSWKARFTRLASHITLFATVSNGTMWIDRARTMFKRMPSI